MQDYIQQTIADLQKLLAEEELVVIERKRLINQLSLVAGQPPIYPDADTDKPSMAMSIRSDQFYGQPFATSVREILTMRKARNQGPATVGEIFAALTEGGFAFDTKNADNARRGMRISLAKNNTMFHKLPTGKFGLREWYPNVKPLRAAKAEEADDNSDAEET